MITLNTNSTTQRLRDVCVGDGVRICDFVNAYECTIGDNTLVGPFVEIQRGVSVGNNCKIESHSFLCEGLTIEDDVQVSHGVVFINDRYPSASIDGHPKREGDWILEKTLVKKGAAIGSNATIMCGITIGENSLVGAGSVVTKDVPDGATVIGNPARVFVKSHRMQNA